MFVGGVIRHSPCGLMADYSANERVSLEPSSEAFSSVSLYLSHDAFNNIKVKISRIDQLLCADKAILVKNTFGAEEDAGRFRPQPLTSSESWKLIGQFPSRRAIFRSNSEGVFLTMAAALHSCQDGWCPIHFYLALQKRI